MITLAVPVQHPFFDWIGTHGFTLRRVIGAGSRTSLQTTLFLTWIVRWIDVGDTKRPRTSNLDVADNSPRKRSAVSLTVSHIAARFELDRGPPTDWQDKEARAIERPVAAWEKYKVNGEDLEAHEG
jgi:hypothetical protein